MAETLLFNALRQAIDEEMGRDQTVFVLGEDVGHYGGSYKVTKDLYKKYGDLRVLDTPIAENSFTGMAVGAAMTGLRPIIEGMNMGFLLLAAKGLLKSAIRDNNPVLFFEHVLLYNLKENLPDTEYLLPLDKAEIVRKGEDITILTYSRMRHHCLQALKQLEKDGYDPEIIDLISLKPFDMETIAASIRKTHRVIIVEECMKTAGIASELIALINEQLFDELDAPVLRLSSQDIPTPYNGNLERLTIIQPNQIVEAVQKMVGDRI